MRITNAARSTDGPRDRQTKGRTDGRWTNVARTDRRTDTSETALHVSDVLLPANPSPKLLSAGRSPQDV